jgi:hypothetical protein
MLGFGPEAPKKQDPMMAALWKETAVMPITRARVILQNEKPDYASAYDLLTRSSGTMNEVYRGKNDSDGGLAEEVYNMSLQVDQSIAELSPYAKQLTGAVEIADRLNTITAQMKGSVSLLYQDDADESTKKVMGGMWESGIVKPAEMAMEELRKGKPNLARAQVLVGDSMQSLTSISRSARPESQIELAGYGEALMVINRQLYALMGKCAPVERIAGDLEVMAINAEELGGRL